MYDIAGIFRVGGIMTIIRPAILRDWAYIDALRKRNGDALGFIPKDAYLSCLSKIPIDGRRRWEYQSIHVIEDNGDLTGFCYASFSGTVAHVFQVVVQEDARRWHRAMLLEAAIRQEAMLRSCSGISCRVAFDLEANWFWRAIGYLPIREVVSTWLNRNESKSKRPLWEYYLALELPLLIKAVNTP